MKVKDAIAELQKCPPDAELMVADMGIGGSVRVEGFEVVDATWVDVMWDSEPPAAELHDIPVKQEPT